jgi:hypothetical protein
MSDRPTFRLTLEFLGDPAGPGVNWNTSLRRALKCLLRRFGWRCRRIEPPLESDEATDHDAPEGRA